MSVIVCDNISYQVGNKSIIKNFNFNFLDHKVYAIIGRRKSGKSTLLKLLSGQLLPTEGTVYLDGKILYKKSPSQ